MINKVKSLVRKLWANVMVRRVVHTFWQAYLAVFVLGVQAVVHYNGNFSVSVDHKALIALVIAAGAAGLAALRTGIYNIWQTRKA